MEPCNSEGQVSNYGKYNNRGEGGADGGGWTLPPHLHLPLKTSPKDLFVNISSSCDIRKNFVLEAGVVPEGIFTGKEAMIAPHYKCMSPITPLAIRVCSGAEH